MTDNYLITGIPRSGTTLLTALMSQNPSYIVFSEPDWLKKIRANSENCSQFMDEFKKQLMFIRKQIHDGQTIQIKQSKSGGGLPTNYYIRNNKGAITSDKEEIPLLVPSNRFNAPFVIKANAQFTSCLEAIHADTEYKTVCIVRNPVAAIMSWRSLNIPVSKGNMKIAEKYSEDFISFTKSAESLLHKQVLIADWFFKQYNQFSSDIILIKYEDLVANPQNELIRITQDIESFSEVKALVSKNKNKHYNFDEQNQIQQCLTKHGKYFQSYYPELIQ